jgi:glycosyltransferase involved in cell wall biosynthesis
MYKVSIIIPTYNRASILRETIIDVLQQEFLDFELIIIDDGSSDDTKEIVRSFEDKRIKYFFKENRGVSSVRNLGIIVASGEYIAFLDDDDYWPKDYLEKMIKALNSNQDFEAAYCIIKKVDKEGKIIHENNRHKYQSGFVTKSLFLHKFLLLSGLVVKKLIARNVMFDENLQNAEDIDFLLRLTFETKFLFIDNIKVEWRHTEGGLSTLPSWNNILVFERFYEKLGGQDFITYKNFKQKLKRVYLAKAKYAFEVNDREAMIFSSLNAVKYGIYDYRAYKYLLKAFLMANSHKIFPVKEPLGEIVTTAC